MSDDPAPPTPETPQSAPAPRKQRAPRETALRNPDGSPFQSADDVARFLGAPPSRLTYLLYTAGDEARYRSFEIPKRGGGMRQISAPRDQLLRWQQRLLDGLQAKYEPHPAAHGFIPGGKRSIVSNAAVHVRDAEAGKPTQLVLNVDLKDFFPSINFGRVRGLFLKPPFEMAPAAAAVAAQLATFRNQLPQGAPTSPILSNMIASELDRRLARIAAQEGLRYSRYADDITFSTTKAKFPASILAYERDAEGKDAVIAGPELARAIAKAGFAINPAKVRLQTRHQRQAVTGLTVNDKPNVTRTRVRRARAMIHAWKKFGLDAAAAEHAAKYASPHRAAPGATAPSPVKRFREAVYGELAFIKMVRGAGDPLFRSLCAQLLDADKAPPRSLRRMAFGASDFDVFISHAEEDKEELARPILEACEALGLNCFLDEANINWGENAALKINSALGAARTVLVIVTPTFVKKPFPMLELNTALNEELRGRKRVLPLMVGSPDLAGAPLLASKDWLTWKGDPKAVAKRLQQAVSGDLPGAGRRPQPLPKGYRLAPSTPAVPLIAVADAAPERGSFEPPLAAAPAPPVKRPGFFARLFGKKPKV